MSKRTEYRGLPMDWSSLYRIAERGGRVWAEVTAPAGRFAAGAVPVEISAEDERLWLRLSACPETAALTGDWGVLTDGLATDRGLAMFNWRGETPIAIYDLVTEAATASP